MLEPATRGATGARRLVLGFDGGCTTCSGLAKRISENVGGKLEVRSLHHPQVEHWREQTLGKDAPWAPTLFEVGGVKEVRAWTGSRMAVRLARALGPVATWRVMQTLGEVGASRAFDAGSSLVSPRTTGISRGQFLKGMGGAAIAFGAFSGTATPAQAGQNELNEDGLVEAFVMIEAIPDSVVARGDEAARRWLKQRMPSDTQSRGVWGCARAVIFAVVSNAIPVLKIRKAIKVYGGARNFARAIRVIYSRFRRLGNGPVTSLKKTAKAVAKRVLQITGENILGALLSLFSLDGVRRECF